MRLSCYLVLAPFLAAAQFAPPAGQAGTTAMYKDSSAFIHWASGCIIMRGPQDISNPGGGFASVGDSSKPIGIADNSIVSLGDGGAATCTFDYPIADGPGYDFAVFENSFSDDYLEFGFVEVSSDGVNYFRFPAVSNIQDTLQTGSFDLSDATKVNNLAGKYRALYGVPFDLQQLQGTPGLNISSVTHVRIVDVVGSINPSYATYDINGNRVNDPWPTAFPSSGFDLDAVGVIHDITNSIKINNAEEVTVYPNPVHRGKNLLIECGYEDVAIQVSTPDGIIMRSVQGAAGAASINTEVFAPGTYFIRVSDRGFSFTSKFIVLP